MGGGTIIPAPDFRTQCRDPKFNCLTAPRPTFFVTSEGDGTVKTFDDQPVAGSFFDTGYYPHPTPRRPQGPEHEGIAYRWSSFRSCPPSRSLCRRGAISRRNCCRTQGDSLHCASTTCPSRDSTGRHIRSLEGQTERRRPYCIQCDFNLG